MRKNINKLFLNIQKHLFSIFFLSVIVNSLYMIFVLHSDWKTIVLQFLEFVKIIYLPIALSVLICHLLVLEVDQLQIYLFYSIWLKLIFKSLKRRTSDSSEGYVHRFSSWVLGKFFNEYYDSLVLKSWHPPTYTDSFPSWLQAKSFKNKPLFIRKEHLMAKKSWPNWAFSTVILFNKLEIHRLRDKESIRFRLEVDLRGQSYGIYNNAGKVFMRNEFLKGNKLDAYIKEASKINEFLRSKDSEESKLVINAKDTPLRWASGGVLPIAYWKKQYWYVLFFRGINPVGWNLANGSSETEEEYKNIHRLMVRELSEELVLLTREPQIDDPNPVVQKIFRFSDQIFEELPEKTKEKIRSKKFIEKHVNLRGNHDKLCISFTQGPILGVVRTPFEIQISHQSENPKEIEPRNIRDIIFSVNPTEFGIESVSLYTFEMDDNDYILFGEIWEVADCLLREPVLLLSCDYIQEVFENNNGTLGTHLKALPNLDCKSLEKIPKDKYHLFDKDIEFRKRRKQKVASQKGVEFELHEHWLEKYGNPFEKIHTGCDIEEKEHSPISVLCPVTWKTLESVCRYDILKKLHQ